MSKKSNLTQEEKLVKSLDKLSSRFDPHVYIIRGFITGIFQALGATIGFALFLVIIAALVDIAGGIPILNYILEETQLDKIIDNQIEQIEEEENQQVNETINLEENDAEVQESNE